MPLRQVKMGTPEGAARTQLGVGLGVMWCRGSGGAAWSRSSKKEDEKNVLLCDVYIKFLSVLLRLHSTFWVTWHPMLVLFSVQFNFLVYNKNDFISPCHREQDSLNPTSRGGVYAKRRNTRGNEEVSKQQIDFLSFLSARLTVSWSYHSPCKCLLFHKDPVMIPEQRPSRRDQLPGCRARLLPLI